MKRKYNINSDGNDLILPYFVLKEGKPYIEYIHGNSVGDYIVREQGNLVYYSQIEDGEDDISIKPEYRELVDAEVVSCPHDIDGRREMEDLWEMCRDWLKTVIAFGSEAELSVTASYAVMTWFSWRYDSMPYLRFIESSPTKSTSYLTYLPAMKQDTGLLGVMV